MNGCSVRRPRAISVPCSGSASRRSSAVRSVTPTRSARVSSPLSNGSPPRTGTASLPRMRSGRAGRSCARERDEFLRRQPRPRRGLRKSGLVGPHGARRRRRDRRRDGDGRDVARSLRPRGPLHRDRDRPAGREGRRDRRHPRRRTDPHERADAGEPPRARGAWPRVSLGASGLRRREPAVHGHDDDRGDARPRRPRDAGAARHRLELARRAHLPLRERRAEGTLPPAPGEGRDHGRRRDDRAAGGVRRRSPRDDGDAAGRRRVLDPQGPQAVHLRGTGRHGHRARALRRRLDRPRRARDVRGGPGARQLRRRARRAQVHDPRLAHARALAYEAAVLQDLVMFGRDQDAARDARELTPLVKWYGTEGAVRVCRLALQIHGGYGVVDEYDVGRFMRDSLITPIYEGTSQIQSLMAVRDLMKWTMKHPRSLLRGGPSPLLAKASFDGRAGTDFAAARGHIVATLRSLVTRVVRRKGPGVLRGAPLVDEDFGPILLHAERITEARSEEHTSRILAERARRIPERRRLAERAARTARLVAERNRRAIALDDGSVFERIAAWRSERN